MTAEEFVKSRIPKARAERQTTHGKQSYWLIRDGRATMWFAEGKTETNAWANAKKRILEIDAEVTHLCLLEQSK